MKPRRLLTASCFLLAQVVYGQTPDKPNFDIFDFQIDGNSVLDDEALEKAVYPFLGPEKTVDDVEKARASLEAAYRGAGYPTVIVAIPEQDINDQGQVRLQVVEGKIEVQHITGSRYYNLDKIRAGVPALAEGQVPHIPSVQAQMGTLAQEAPDRNVTPVFRAGSTPGKMEVEMKVKDELPFHGSVEMNSRSSSNTSYTRLIGSLRYDNLWQRYHSASIQYQVSPENSQQVDVWSGTYVLPTGWADTKLAMYGIGISSNTPLGANIGDSNVIGSGNIYGFRLAKPITGESQQNIAFGFDYKSFDQTTSLAGQDTGHTAIQYTKFVATYDNNWRDEVMNASFNLGLNFAVRELGNNQGQFNLKRTGSKADFMYLSNAFNFNYKLPMDFLIHSRAQGQVSMNPLISNEQFSVGGPISVRGYHQTQLLADDGVNLSFELYTPKLIPDDWLDSQSLRLLSFFDWANVWTIAPIAPTAPSSHLASTGLGLRSQWTRQLLGEFDWSYPLYQQNNVAVGQQRVDFRMVYQF